MAVTRRGAEDVECAVFENAYESRHDVGAAHQRHGINAAVSIPEAMGRGGGHTGKPPYSH